MPGTFGVVCVLTHQTLLVLCAPSLVYTAPLHAVAMQVLTACLKSFAHGANDTANAAGPFAAVQSLYLNTDTGCQGIGTPLWVLAFCGVGIVVVGFFIASIHCKRSLGTSTP